MDGQRVTVWMSEENGGSYFNSYIINIISQHNHEMDGQRVTVWMSEENVVLFHFLHYKYH